MSSVSMVYNNAIVYTQYVYYKSFTTYSYLPIHSAQVSLPTRVAACRLMPIFPALVDSRNRLHLPLLFVLLNLCMSSCRSEVGIEPSIRRYSLPFCHRERLLPSSLSLSSSISMTPLDVVVLLGSLHVSNLPQLCWLTSFSIRSRVGMD